MSVFDWLWTGMSGGDSHVPEQYTYDDRQITLNRSYQHWLEDKYRDRIEGKSPSVAEAQLRSGLNQAQAAQWAQSRSATGSGAARGAAQYNAAQNAANMGQQTAADAAKMRAAEQAQAEQAYGQMLADQRRAEQDYQLGKAAAHNQWQSNWSNQSEAQVSRDQRAGGGLVSAAGAAIAAGAMMSDVRAKTDIRPVEETPGDKVLTKMVSKSPELDRDDAQRRRDEWDDMMLRRIQDERSQAATQQSGQDAMGTLGTGLMAAGGIIGSDERAKDKGGDAGNPDVDDFLEKTKAYWWRYKRGERWDDGGRQHIGPMAQDLQRTKVGRTMVVEDPRTGMLGVDTGQAYGAMLAGLTHLNDRIDSIESGKGRK